MDIATKARVAWLRPGDWLRTGDAMNRQGDGTGAIRAPRVRVLAPVRSQQGRVSALSAPRWLDGGRAHPFTVEYGGPDAQVISKRESGACLLAGLR